MITRRTVVIRLRAGIAACLAGCFSLPRLALAKAEAEPQGSRENCSFLIDVRTILARRVEAGELPMMAETSVRCPLCKETITVTAREAVAYVANASQLSA